MSGLTQDTLQDQARSEGQDTLLAPDGTTACENAVSRLDPESEDHAYFLGLLATDGTIYETSRKRGRIAFELAERDSSLLQTLAGRIPFRSTLTRRRRVTNSRVIIRRLS